MTQPGLTELVRELLAPIVRDAVEAALAQHAADAEPEPLLDRAGLGKLLGASLPKVDELVRDGLPHVWVGRVRRFDRATVLSWLSGREGGGATDA